MASSERRTELFVGLFFLVGLLLLGGLIIQFGRFGDRIRGHYEVTVIFDDASGLIKGSEVRMGGAKIGKVAAAPELNEAVKVQVVLSVDDRIRIPSGSNIQIASASLLGDKLVVITPPVEKTGAYLEPNQTVFGGAPGGLDAIADQATKVTEDVRRLMKNTEGTVIKIDSAVDDLRAVTGRLGETVEKVNVSILSDKNLANVDDTIANLKDATAEWKKASTELQPAIADAREAIHSIQKAADGADKAITDIRPAFKEVPKAVDAIANAADSIGHAVSKAEKSEGLLGALAYDKDTGTDARTFIRNLRQRGILRYKDAEMEDENDPRNRFRGKRR
ncbi:MCE family protein [Luteolibacter ambystomatis]|uniref:MCE family protein n=1 Tax=Luteolibacter ambystomatis TaxID=2824561 RepID=A0A975G6U6_9BACT|nr:MlaD family protein [Luteolibacter ambystomatis]QUE50412.1 MCE family protein [Luteolibacter ambystomatis]